MPRRAFLGRAATAAFATLALAAPLGTAAAQAFVADSTITAAPAAAAPVGPIGPTLAGARAGATQVARDSAVAEAAAPVPGPRAGRPVALMAVGAAGIVLGLLIGGGGGKAVAVGGAVVGLVGLYEFVR